MKGLSDPRPVGKLEARIVRALRSGSTLENLRKTLGLHERAVRRELKRLEALGVVRQRGKRSEAAVWSARP